MVTYVTVHTVGLILAFLAATVVYLAQALYFQSKRHTMAMDDLDEARRLQIEAVSAEVWTRDARIIRLNTSNTILQNDRGLANARADREEGARRAANKLVEVRTRTLQGMEIEIRNLKEHQEALTVRVQAVKAAAGALSAKAHAVTSQVLRPGVQEIPTAAFVEIATAAKNTRQAARTLEVFAS